MKKPLRLFAACLLSLVLVSSAFGGPNLTIPEASFDFGFVPQHAKISHIFWLYSTGDSTLRITNIVPGWGCTKAPLEKEELAVGDSTRLEIIFSTGRYKNKINKRPKIKTNEDAVGKNVHIMATVVERPDSTYPVQLKPYKLDLTQFGDKVRDEVTFKITNVSDKELKPTMVAFAEKYFKVELPEVVKPGEYANATVKLTEQALEMEFEKSFTIAFDDTVHSRYTMPVKRKLRPGTAHTVKTDNPGH